MRLQVTYWDIACETANKTVEIDIEFEKQENVEIVPYQEEYSHYQTIDYNVFISGNLPEEIKDVIINNFHEDKNFYRGKTDNFEFEAK